MHKHYSSNQQQINRKYAASAWCLANSPAADPDPNAEPDPNADPDPDADAEPEPEVGGGSLSCKM